MRQLNMSNGGRRKRHGSYDPQRNQETDSFSQAVVRVGVGQICKNEGFQAFQQSALDAFIDVAIRYMLDIGKTAVAAANLAGRTQPNAFDIIHVLEFLNTVVGFDGASQIHRCLLGSGAVTEILNYVDVSKEIPFAYPLPKLSVPKNRRNNLSFVQSGEESPYRHIPSWLPKFYDSLTAEEKEPNELEKPLIPDSHNGLGLLKKTKEEKSTVINPLTAEPISSCMKKVVPVVLASDVDAQMNGFAGNIIDAEQSSGDKLNDPNLGHEKVLFERRSTVLFKIKSSKKFLRNTLHLSFLGEDVNAKDCLSTCANGIDGHCKKIGEALEESSMGMPKEMTMS